MTITSPINSQAVLMANVAMPLVETTEVEAATVFPFQEMIVAAAKMAGVNGKTAVKVAYCESTLRQFDLETLEPLRGVHNPADVGLFQINEKYHLEASQKDGYDIYTAQGNIDYAMHLMKRDGLRHWTYSQPCWDKEEVA